MNAVTLEGRSLG